MNYTRHKYGFLLFFVLLFLQVNIFSMKRMQETIINIDENFDKKNSNIEPSFKSIKRIIDLEDLSESINTDNKDLKESIKHDDILRIELNNKSENKLENKPDSKLESRRERELENNNVRKNEETRIKKSGKICGFEVKKVKKFCIMTPILCLLSYFNFIPYLGQIENETLTFLLKKTIPPLSVFLLSGCNYEVNECIYGNREQRSANLEGGDQEDSENNENREISCADIHLGFLDCLFNSSLDNAIMYGDIDDVDLLV